MQQNRSKRYRAAAEQVDRNKAYNLNEAVSALKKMPPTKFDQTVTVSFRLGVDPKQSDQMVRGTCPLPHGSGKQVRVLVFAEGAAAKAAKDAGAATVNYGVFLNTLINFLIIAGVMFGVVKGMNRLKREEPAPAPPATIKDCPFCATAIPLRATRCPHCTSGL